jgi:hypothetical protein
MFTATAKAHHGRREVRMRTLVMAAALLVCSSAWSQDDGLYIGFAVGLVNMDSACAPGSGACESDGSLLKATIGYQFTPRFAIEAAYSDLGGTTRRRSPSDFGDQLKLSAAELSAIGTWRIDGDLALHARAGVYQSLVIAPDGEHDDFPVGPSGPAQDRGLQTGGRGGLTLGLGMRYRMSESAVIRAEWQHFNGFGGGAGATMDIDAFSVGVLFYFN